MPEHRHPAVGWNGAWRSDLASVAAMRAIPIGATIQVVKRAPEGHEATRYPASRVQTAAPAPWIELVADWVIPGVVVAGLELVPGDTMREFFSAEHPFNAFAVISPEGSLRGWYGNVTYPTTIEPIDGVQSLVWHDLYLDVVTLPGGGRFLLDDDELAASGIPASDPAFAAAIEQARRDLIAIIPRLAPDLRP
jgi:predicted RNA-binding protein associated with RNAse of E/G family